MSPRRRGAADRSSASRTPAPRATSAPSIDGFEISGYSQAIVRDFYESQRFDITNNHIHDNKCANDKLAGAGFALNNVSGRIEGNVFRNNSCGRGGAGFLNDSTKENTVTIERNLIDGNAGTEPDTAHGGALYLFGKTLRITGNLFTAQQRDPMGRRPLRRRRHVQRPASRRRTSTGTSIATTAPATAAAACSATTAPPA